MANAWNVTEAEYKEAMKRWRNNKTSSEESAAYWQLVRFYHGEPFLHAEASHAVRLIRQSRKTAL